VRPDPASHALAEIELGEPEEAGWIIIVVVFGHLPTASCFQNHTGGIQEIVGSLIIPSLLLHTHLPLIFGLTDRAGAPLQV